jgi:hypothetical protein
MLLQQAGRSDPNRPRFLPWGAESRMSRLWDTPEFWVRIRVDEMLRDYPVLTADALAGRLEHSRVHWFNDPDLCVRS